MSFFEKALNIQKQIQEMPVQDMGFETFESKQQSSVRISHLIANKSEDLQKLEQQRLHDEFNGSGPLEFLFLNDNITEIIINSKDQIWFENKGILQKHNDAFSSDLTFHNFIERLCLETKIQINTEIPFANGIYRNFRVHMIGKEIYENGFCLTLRRIRYSPWTLQSLSDLNWAPPQAIDIIKNWLNNKKSFLIIGETGSGKTSVLNACLQALPDNERVVILEDTSEIKNPNTVSTKLSTRYDSNGILPNIDLTELVKQSLRMRPDRLVVGEVRGGEAKDLLLALSTGHAGSMGTLHASSATQALLRLEMLVQLGAPNWNLHTIRRLLALSLHGIIVVGKNNNGERKLISINTLSSVEDMGILLDTIWE